MPYYWNRTLIWHTIYIYIILINRGNPSNFQSSGKVPFERESFMMHNKESTICSPAILTSSLSNLKISIPVLSDKDINSVMRSIRWTSLNLNVYILFCPFHNNELSPVNEELIKSGAFLKYMFISSALIFLGIDLILILGIILPSSAQNERGFVRDELLTSVKYSFFLSFIISVTVFLNFLYSFISESSFLFTANSWILSLLYMSLTISLVIHGFDLTFNRAVLWEQVYLKDLKKHFSSLPLLFLRDVHLINR